MTKPKLIVPKHVWDGAQAEKKKNEVEKALIYQRNYLYDLKKYTILYF